MFAYYSSSRLYHYSYQRPFEMLMDKPSRPVPVARVTTKEHLRLVFPRSGSRDAVARGRAGISSTAWACGRLKPLETPSGLRRVTSTRASQISAREACTARARRRAGGRREAPSDRWGGRDAGLPGVRLGRWGRGRSQRGGSGSRAGAAQGLWRARASLRMRMGTLRDVQAGLARGHGGMHRPRESQLG